MSSNWLPQRPQRNPHAAPAAVLPACRTGPARLKASLSAA
ncbi:hypothetical protein FHR36_003303 [Kitasatospora paracochleata]|uniref:Uncharacterized protein n=1 Tax=Kitasatospora paracochleata TaxID=58354 RepID=A0ABT1IYD6_9ACTN|nr:hypothetical protein [Kitasatospora paracochleata]